MPTTTEAKSDFEKFLAGSLAIVGSLFGALIISPSESSLAVGIGGGLGAMIGYYVGVHTARLIAFLLLVVLTLIAYSFRNEVLRAIFEVMLNG